MKKHNAESYRGKTRMPVKRPKRSDQHAYAFFTDNYWEMHYKIDNNKNSRKSDHFKIRGRSTKYTIYKIAKYIDME